MLKVLVVVGCVTEMHGDRDTLLQTVLTVEFAEYLVLTLASWAAWELKQVQQLVDVTDKQVGQVPRQDLELIQEQQQTKHGVLVVVTLTGQQAAVFQEHQVIVTIGQNVVLVDQDKADPE